MGDFDRNVNPAAAKPSETKKLVIVLGLGAVLMVLVALQFMKHGDSPQAAAGAPANNGVALPPPVVAEEISIRSLADMQADLQNDPTQNYLRQDVRTDASLNEVPRNPFAMDGTWFHSLLKPQVVNVGPTTSTAPAPVRPTQNPTPVAPLLAPRPEDYRISSVVNGNMAIINGKIVKVGDIVGKARVIQISDAAVVLQLADTPTGPTIEISTSTRLNKDN